MSKIKLVVLTKARKDYTDKLGRTWKWNGTKYVYQKKTGSTTSSAEHDGWKEGKQRPDPDSRGSINQTTSTRASAYGGKYSIDSLSTSQGTFHTLKHTDSSGKKTLIQSEEPHMRGKFGSYSAAKRAADKHEQDNSPAAVAVKERVAHEEKKAKVDTGGPPSTRSNKGRNLPKRYRGHGN